MNWFRLGGRKELLAGVFLLAMGISHATLLITVLPQLRCGYQDFTIFYAAGRMVRNGQTRSLYDLNAQYLSQKEFASEVRSRAAALPYNHPPFEALLFVPLTFVGYIPAYLIWTSLNLVMLAASLLFLRRLFGEVERIPPLLLALAAVGFFPVAISLIQGQDSIFLLLITVLAMAASAKEKNVAAGVLLALGLFKFHLMIPFALVVAARRPRMLAGFFPLSLVLVSVSIVMVGWAGSFEYVRFLLHLENQGASAGISAAAMPSLHGMLASIGGARPGQLWSIVLLVTISAAVMVAALQTNKRNRITIEKAFALAAVTALLVGYHTMPHDLSLLLPATIFVFTAILKSPSDSRADVFLLVLLFLTPLYLFLGPFGNRMGLLGIVLLWLFLRILRGKEPTQEAA